MIDLNSLLKHPYELSLDLRLSDSLINEILGSFALPKSLKALSVIFHVDLVIIFMKDYSECVQGVG